jgi:hypothetical protein
MRTRPAQVPGGWGAEESETRTEPNPVSVLIPGEVDPDAAEFGQHYELLNERVIGDSVPDWHGGTSCGHGVAAKPLPPQAFGAIMNET